MTSGLISVIMPCHDAGDYVVEAMESVLGQTHEHLEVLALDDGSTDQTLDHLERAASNDARVRVMVHPENLGLIHTLNRGVQEARGEYIARMDADDFSHPDRLRRQLAVLARRSDVGVVSAATELMDSAGTIAGRVPIRCVEPGAARFLSLFATPLVHAAILARSHVMRDFPYRSDANSLHTEDYELFSRMVRNGVGFYNIDEPLYRQRIWPGSVSRRFESIQVEHFVATARAHLKELMKLEVPDGEHRALVNRLTSEVEARELARALRLLDALRDRFLDGLPTGDPVRDEVHRITAEQRTDILLQAALKGTAAQRAAALVLGLRYLPSLLSAPSRTYLSAKFASKRRSHLV